MRPEKLFISPVAIVICTVLFGTFTLNSTTFAGEDPNKNLNNSTHKSKQTENSDQDQWEDNEPENWNMTDADPTETSSPRPKTKKFRSKPLAGPSVHQEDADRALAIQVQQEEEAFVRRPATMAPSARILRPENLLGAFLNVATGSTPTSNAISNSSTVPSVLSTSYHAPAIGGTWARRFANRREREKREAREAQEKRNNLSIVNSHWGACSQDAASNSTPTPTSELSMTAPAAPEERPLPLGVIWRRRFEARKERERLENVSSGSASRPTPPANSISSASSHSSSSVSVHSAVSLGASSSSSYESKMDIESNDGAEISPSESLAVMKHTKRKRNKNAVQDDVQLSPGYCYQFTIPLEVEGSLGKSLEEILSRPIVALVMEYDGSHLQPSANPKRQYRRYENSGLIFGPNFETSQSDTYYRALALLAQENLSARRRGFEIMINLANSGSKNASEFVGRAYLGISDKQESVFGVIEFDEKAARHFLSQAAANDVMGNANPFAKGILYLLDSHRYLFEKGAPDSQRLFQLGIDFTLQNKRDELRMNESSIKKTEFPRVMTLEMLEREEPTLDFAAFGRNLIETAKSLGNENASRYLELQTENQRMRAMIAKKI